LDGKSEDILKGKIKELKKLFPEAVTDGKVDIEMLKATLGSEMNTDNERYVLNWAGKAEAFRVLQQPTTATLAPAPKESLNFDTTENIFIEGENLEVLKILQKSYYGKIKMIYIDPPYNTGNDSFIYPDKFAESKDEYLKRIGEKDEEGYLLKEGLFRKNSKENGQFHSVWLSMMYPRLFLARNLLRDDGVIFISIDDNEVHNLRMVMNEIFGEENFIGNIAWKKTSGDNKASFAFTHDNVVIYGKNDNEIQRAELSKEQKLQYSNPDNDKRGDWAESDYRSKWTKRERKNLYYGIKHPKTGKIIYPDTYSDSSRVWACSKETHDINMKNNLIWWGINGESNEPKKKRFLNEHKGVNTRSVWLDAGTNDEASHEIKELFPESPAIFDNPKPTKLIIKMLNIVTNENDIILDFFAGSATTAHAVYKSNIENKNLKYISVQLPEKCYEESEAFKAGYKTIAEIGKERIRRAIKQIKQENKNLFNKDKAEINLGFKVFKLKDTLASLVKTNF